MKRIDLKLMSKANLGPSFHPYDPDDQPPQVERKQSRKILKGDPRVLINLRTIMRLTQAELAEKLRVSANTVARWERGEVAPPYIASLAAGYIYLQEFVSKSGDEHIRDYAD